MFIFIFVFLFIINRLKSTQIIWSLNIFLLECGYTENEFKKNFNRFWKIFHSQNVDIFRWSWNVYNFRFTFNLWFSVLRLKMLDRELTKIFSRYSLGFWNRARKSIRQHAARRSGVLTGVFLRRYVVYPSPRSHSTYAFCLRDTKTKKNNVQIESVYSFYYLTRVSVLVASK